MIKKIDFHIDELDDMKKYPQELSYIGNLNLLNKRKISIVGTRKPIQYTQQSIYTLSSKLSSKDICIVSGAAMGVDAIAHNAAGANNTIAISGTGLDIRYPSINSNLIKNIEKNGLIISQFKEKTPATRYSFPIRNELIVALGEILIVAQADLNSGTMRSVEFAIKMKKPIYVLSHRINESDGTNQLLEKGLATAIYDIDDFIEKVIGCKGDIKNKDSFLEYCKSNPTYDEAMVKYPSQLFENELSGKIKISNGSIFLT